MASKRRKPHYAVAVTIVGCAIALGATQVAQADELALSCAPLAKRQENHNGFNVWIDLSNSTVLMAFFDMDTPNSYGSNVWPGAEATISYTAISWSVNGGHSRFFIDRSSGQATQNYDGWILHYSCDRTSAPKPATKF